MASPSKGFLLIRPLFTEASEVLCGPSFRNSFLGPLHLASQRAGRVSTWRTLGKISGGFTLPWPELSPSAPRRKGAERGRPGCSQDEDVVGILPSAASVPILKDFCRRDLAGGAPGSQKTLAPALTPPAVNWVTSRKSQPLLVPDSLSIQ